MIVKLGQIAIAAVFATGLSTASSFAGSTTPDGGYTVDPCYKKCAPLLASITPKQEAKRVYKNCFAYCSHKGLITCPNGVFVNNNRFCP